MGRPHYELIDYLRRLVPDYHPEGSAHNISGRQERQDTRITGPAPLGSLRQ